MRLFPGHVGSGRGVVTVSGGGSSAGHPPLSSTPPPPWDAASGATGSMMVSTSSPRVQVRSSHTHVTTVAIQEDRTDVVRKGQKLRFKGLAEDPQSVTEPVLVSYKEIKSTAVR
ncbi:putative phosphatidylinositol 4-phosphate 5-kinase type-1 beta-like 1 [Homarus americanus]|uniref:Putative phosphatidylinositol 4-phosphate 5-kinase type-1 beta-like 1 n=1 Tax=Homarus americanus TaxID=6706 RepID=A0A8J5JP81_HOMAM|nr:putative phosphatidylinositol 4-phosphate 5-kinase type-1 beta-like 1 [Homarus americanus]